MSADAVSARTGQRRRSVLAGQCLQYAGDLKDAPHDRLRVHDDQPCVVLDSPLAGMDECGDTRRVHERHPGEIDNQGGGAFVLCRVDASASWPMVDISISPAATIRIVLLLGWTVTDSRAHGLPDSPNMISLPTATA
jgi:hypothetical protein